MLATIAGDAVGVPAYALEAAIFIAGAAVQWLRDGLGVIQTPAETEVPAPGIPSTLRADGGATENGWLMQFHADVLGMPVERPDVIETTALGAAGLVGLGAGVWPSADAFLACRRFRRFMPGDGAAAAPAGAAGWARAVRAALAWVRDDA